MYLSRATDTVERTEPSRATWGSWSVKILEEEEEKNSEVVIIK